LKFKYQLVIQFDANDDEADYDKLLVLEESVIENIGQLGAVDGHDIGSGECNIFVHTNDAPKAFDGIKEIVTNGLPNMRAAYRDFKKEAFIPLWPKGLKKFEVI
jgi:hypothetical protein